MEINVVNVWTVLNRFSIEADNMSVMRVGQSVVIMSACDASRVATRLQQVRTYLELPWDIECVNGAVRIY